MDVPHKKRVLGGGRQALHICRGEDEAEQPLPNNELMSEQESLKKLSSQIVPLYFIESMRGKN